MSAVVESNFVYDPFSIEVMSNPTPFYKTLREDHPVYSAGSSI